MRRRDGLRWVGFVFVIVVLGMAAGLKARGEDPPAAPLTPREMFLQLDANNDQVLDREEVPEAGRSAFDVLLKHGDVNRNGKLEAAEYRELVVKAAQAPALNLAGRFEALDRDGDGKLSRDEFPGPAPLFQRLDADKDGSVTRAEVAALRNANGAAVPAPRFRALDRDGNGTLGRDEFPGRPAAFDRLDRDHDGRLSLEEFRQRGK